MYTLREGKCALKIKKVWRLYISYYMFYLDMDNVERNFYESKEYKGAIKAPWNKWRLKEVLKLICYK